MLPPGARLHQQTQCKTMQQWQISPLPPDALVCMIQCRVWGQSLVSRSSATALWLGKCLKPLRGRAVSRWDRSHESCLVSLYLRFETNNCIWNKVSWDSVQGPLFGTILVTLWQLVHWLKELATLLRSQIICAAYSALCLVFMVQKQITAFCAKEQFLSLGI